MFESTFQGASFKLNTFGNNVVFAAVLADAAHAMHPKYGSNMYRFWKSAAQVDFH